MKGCNTSKNIGLFYWGYVLFISFIFIDVNVYRLKYEKDWVIERIIYYVRLYKQKAKVRDKGIINARMGEKKLVI